MTPSRAAVIALLVIPLTAIPAYFVGHAIIDALDHNSGNGQFELGGLLGIAVLLVTLLVSCGQTECG